MHVRVCVSSLLLVMTSFDWNIVSYGMSLDGHSDRGMKGDHIDKLINVCVREYANFFLTFPTSIWQRIC